MYFASRTHLRENEVPVHRPRQKRVRSVFFFNLKPSFFLIPLVPFRVSSPHYISSPLPSSVCLYFCYSVSLPDLIKMESTGYGHRQSPSSDRFLGAFYFWPPSSTGGVGDELNEAEVFWTSDFTEPHLSDNHHDHHRRFNFPHQKGSGVLAVLPEADQQSSRTLPDGPLLCRKPSISSTSSSSKVIPLIPRWPEREYSQSVQGTNFHHHRQSAPMNVPVLSEAMRKRRNRLLAAADDDDGDDTAVLPPHEIVARGSGVSPNTTFSVLEGVGRTLKGRDLRQVRNAVWRKTGFLD